MTLEPSLQRNPKELGPLRSTARKRSQLVLAGQTDSRLAVRGEVSKRGAGTQMVASQGRSYGLGISVRGGTFTEAQLDSKLLAFSVCLNVHSCVKKI